MSPNIRIDKKFNLKKIKFNLYKELNLGGVIVRQDHIDRLDRVTIFPGDKRVYSGTSVTQKDVGGFHQAGTRPYTITPKKAKFLRFKTASGVVYTKKVNHPGLPKREWFGISKTAEQRVLKMVGDRIERELIRA